MTKRASPHLALAVVMTVLVLSLLAIAIASKSRTRGYAPFAKNNHSAQHPDRGDRVEIEALDDFAVRVLVTLRQAPDTAPQVDVLVSHPTQSGQQVRHDDLRTVPARTGRQDALEFSATLFALFGLFVLWWGRDRASLWLGLFCASFAPPLLQQYGVLPEWGMLLAYVFTDVLFFLSVFAFFEIARTFAQEALPPNDPFCRWMATGREVALAVVLFAGAVNFANTIGPTVFGEPVWDWVLDLGTLARELAIVGVLCLGPLALLAVGWWRAVDEAARGRVRVTLFTTLAAESGVLVAIAQEAAHGQPPTFSNTWYTLLAIPIGFLFSIPAYKVVEVKVVLNRILVLTTMTAAIAAAITLSETWVDEVMQDRVRADALGGVAALTHLDSGNFAEVLRFGVAFTIVLTFARFHHILDEFFQALFFRRRDEAVKALYDFAAKRAPFITRRADVLQQAVALVCGAVGARGAALYEESAGGYSRAAHCGEVAWPDGIGENDPAFAIMRGGRARVVLGELEPTPSALGEEGATLRMAVGNRVVGALVIGARAKESDGPYEREEYEVLEEVARSVVDALANLRAAETSQFVRDVADGSVRGVDAMQRAASLCARGLPGVDAATRSPAPEARPSADLRAVGRRDGG